MNHQDDRTILGVDFKKLAERSRNLARFRTGGLILRDSQPMNQHP